MLKKTISNGPVGLPLAANISEVTPNSDAMSVRYPSLSKIKKNTVMIRREESHKPHSNGEKYFKIRFIYPSKKAPASALQGPNVRRGCRI